MICSAADSFANIANNFKINNNHITSSSSSLSSTRYLVSGKKYNRKRNLKKEKKPKKDKKDKKEKKDKKNKDKAITRTTSSKSPVSPPVLPPLTLTSCILAIYGSPIEYEDEEVESSKLQLQLQLPLPWKMTTDKATSHIIQELFPSWYISTAAVTEVTAAGMSEASMNNPLYNKTKFTRSTRINNFCLKY